MGSSVSLTMLCLKHVSSLLLLCGLARAFSMDESTDRSNSEVFPLVFNPFDVSHFKCLGYTLFENTVASSAYTYEVDVCFLAALATKLAFPWIYQYFTGESLFPQLRELGIPLLDSARSADVRGEAGVRLPGLPGVLRVQPGSQVGSQHPGTCLQLVRRAGQGGDHGAKQEAEEGADEHGRGRPGGSQLQKRSKIPTGGEFRPQRS